MQVWASALWAQRDLHLRGVIFDSLDELFFMLFESMAIFYCYSSFDLGAAVLREERPVRDDGLYPWRCRTALSMHLCIRVTMKIAQGLCGPQLRQGSENGL